MPYDRSPKSGLKSRPLYQRLTPLGWISAAGISMIVFASVLFTINSLVSRTPRVVAAGQPNVQQIPVASQATPIVVPTTEIKTETSAGAIVVATAVIAQPTAVPQIVVATAVVAQPTAVPQIVVATAVIAQPTAVPKVITVATGAPAPVVVAPPAQPQATAALSIPQQPVIATPIVKLSKSPSGSRSAVAELLVGRPVVIAIAPAVIVLIIVLGMVMIRLGRDYN